MPHTLKQIYSIIKMGLIENWTKAFSSKRRGNTKTFINPAIRGIIVAVVVLVLLMQAFIGFFNNLIELMGPQILPSAAFICTFLSILITDFLSLGSALFETGRYQQLKTMPISQLTIAWARLIDALSGSFISALIFMLCGVIAWSAHVDILSLIRLAVFGTILVPLYTSIFSILCFCAGYALKRKFRGGHIFVMALVTCIVIVPAIIIGYSLAIPELQSFILPYLNSITTVLSFVDIFAAACMGDILALAKLAVPIMVIYTIFSTWLARNLDSLIALKDVRVQTRSFSFEEARTNDTHTQTNKQTDNLLRAIVIKHRSMVALIKKDGLFLRHSSAVAMNVLIGPLFGLAAASCLCLFPYINHLEGHILCTVVACIPIYTNLAPASLYAITLEGNKWWHLQTMPLLARDIMRAKLIAATTPIGITLAIEEVLYNIFLPLSLAERFALLIMPFASIAFLSICALAIDASDPNFSWDDTHEIAHAFKKQKWTLLLFVLCYICIGITALVCFNPLGEFFGGDTTYVTCTLLGAAILLGIAYFVYDHLMNAPLVEG